MLLEVLIIKYGYVALFFGTFFEGEVVLIVAGFLACYSYLELPYVVIVATLGTLAGDQLFFILGYTKGVAFLKRRKHWKMKSQKVICLLHKYQISLMISFRFLYGLRSVTPFVIGMSGLSPLRFFILNAIGALMWATVIGSLGYLLGDSLENVPNQVRKYQVGFISVIFLAISVIWLVYLVRQKNV